MWLSRGHYHGTGFRELVNLRKICPLTGSKLAISFPGFLPFSPQKKRETLKTSLWIGALFVACEEFPTFLPVLNQSRAVAQPFTHKNSIWASYNRYFAPWHWAAWLCVSFVAVFGDSARVFLVEVWVARFSALWEQAEEFLQYPPFITSYIE